MESRLEAQGGLLQCLSSLLVWLLLGHASVLKLFSLLVVLNYLGFTNLFSYLMKALDLPQKDTSMHIRTTLCSELQGIHRPHSKDRQWIQVENPCAKPHLLPHLDSGNCGVFSIKKSKQVLGFVGFFIFYFLAFCLCLEF